MPRLPISLLRKAFSESPLLVDLLCATHDLDLARNELRWLKEHLTSIHRLKTTNPGRYPQRLPRLQQLCRTRSTGKPLQYILGSQPFGDLEILCRKGVLIPRPETETYTSRLADLLLQHGHVQGETEPLRILDLCAGTGCIGLSLLASLHGRFPVQIRAIDINEQARHLAWKSVRLNQCLGRLPVFSANADFEYVLSDMLNPEEDSNIVATDEIFHVTVANPPYISLPSFTRDTSRSARNFEPRNALVPPLSAIERLDLKGEETGDLFYTRILEVSSCAESQIVCMEVADLEQALRVVALLDEMEVKMGRVWDVRQIWCDGIDEQGSQRVVMDAGLANVTVLGSGNGRAVVLARGRGVEVISSGGLVST